MKPQILVAIDSQDRLSQLMPYIEKIAQPGMQVIFLIRWHAQQALTAALPRPLEFNGDDAPLITDYDLEAKRAPERQGECTEERLTAEHRLFLAEEALIKRGIEVTVDVYTGSFRKAVASYMWSGNVYMIIRPARGLSAISQLLYKMVPNFSTPTPSAFPPMHLQWTTGTI
jgi:hypothetical protein